MVTFAEGGPKRGGMPSESRGERSGDFIKAPPLHASAAFLSDPHCDVVRDDDNALAFRCPPGPEEDPELGPSYRTMAFDFAEEEKKMGLDPGECVIGDSQIGVRFHYPGFLERVRMMIHEPRKGANTTASLIAAKERAKAAARTRSAQNKWAAVKTLVAGSSGGGRGTEKEKEKENAFVHHPRSPRRRGHGGAQLGAHEYNSDPRSAAASASSLMISSEKILRLVKRRLLNRLGMHAIRTVRRSLNVLDGRCGLTNT